MDDAPNDFASDPRFHSTPQAVLDVIAALHERVAAIEALVLPLEPIAPKISPAKAEAAKIKAAADS